jgi:hypothetical protein
VPNCYPQEAAAPGRPVALTPAAVPTAPAVAAPGQPYAVPAAAAARLPGPIVAMAPVSSKRDRQAARRAATGPSIEDQSDDTYIPFAAVPVAAGPQPQRVPSYEVINVETGPNPVSAVQPGPQPAGAFATAAAPTWQHAVTCKPNQNLPLAVNRLPTGDAYPF